MTPKFFADVAERTFKAVFGVTSPVIVDIGEDYFVVNGLTFQQIEMDRRTIGKTIKVQGWDLSVEVPMPHYHDEPEYSSLVELGQNQNCYSLIAIAVKEHANKLAENFLECEGLAENFAKV